MSKKIVIKEGDTGRNFTADKLRTNLQGGGTCDWVPIDEAGQYVELEEITITENGTYTPTEKAGFSQVTVNVEGGGGDLGGEPIEARAVGNITAYTCVGINYGSAGTPSQVPCSIPTDPYFYTDVAYGNGYVYYIEPATNNIYKLPLDDLSGTPELYLQSDMPPYVQRNLACYKKDNKVILEDLSTGNTLEFQNLYPGPSPVNLGELLLGKEYFTGLYEDNDPKLYGMNATRAMDGYYLAGYPTASDGSGFSLYNPNGNTIKRIYTGSLYSIGMIDDSGFYKFALNDTSLLDGRILLRDSNGNICTSDFSASSAGYHELKNQGNNLVTDYSGRVFQWNAEGSRVFANLGSHGLVVFKDVNSFDVYSGITSIDSATCCMFSHYFWDGKRLWDLNNEYPTMAETNSKEGGDMLGYVKLPVLNGEIGTAYVLFS